MPFLLKFAAALAVGAGVCSALDPSRLVSQYTLRTWTQAQGLPQDSVRALAQTADGYLWVGTDEGLARFDGYSFDLVRSADLPASAIRALKVASGTLWIGTAYGLARYENGKFTRVANIGNLPVTAIAETRDRAVWIAAGMRLFRFARGAVTDYGPENGLAVEGVRAILPLSADGLAVAGYGAVGIFQNGRTTSLSTTREMSGSVPTSLLRTSSGLLLAGGTQGLFSGTPAGKWERLADFGGFVRALASDRDGNVWVGTNSGLFRWRPGSANPLSRSERFAADWIWCIFEDREGTLWVGTNNGLFQFVNQSVAVYGREEGLPSDEPVGVAEDAQRRIWAGFHNAGLGYLAGKQFHRILPGEEVLSLRRASGGDILAGTRSGLYRISGERVVWSWRPRDTLGRANVFDVAEDRSGAFWLGTNGGLLRVAGGRATLGAPGGTVLDDAVVAVLVAADGTVWAGTYGNGLWRVRGTDRVRFTAASGLPSDQIRALYQDREGVLWIATFGGGVAFFRDGTFTSVPASAGLPSQNIGSIIGDGESLWLGTTRGIVRIPRASLVHLSTDGARAFGADQGLRGANAAPGYPTSSGGIRAAGGAMWFPTARGLAQIGKREPESVSTMPVHIVEAMADGLPWNPADALAPAVRRVEFRYAAVHLSSPKAVRYRFRLEPYDKDWNEAGTRRVAAYSNLRRGDYRLRVAAALAGSEPWVEAQALPFRKRPWYYETWWFAAAAAAVVAALMWSAWRYRLAQERRRFASVLDERSRLARELHDTLAQGYVGIASQLGAAKTLIQSKPDVAAEQVELARRMAQHSLTEARRSIADLRSAALDSGNIEQAFRSGLQGIAAAPITFDFVHAPRSLPPETAHYLLRIAQEAVSNAAKHGKPAHIEVKFGQADRTLRLTITDDGSGFDVEQTGVRAGHFGLLGMRERAELLGGTLEVRSQRGSGTTIEVQIAE